MRSFISKAAIAAILVSTSLAGAYAASSSTPQEHIQREVQARNPAAHDTSNPSNTIDETTTAAITPAPAMHASTAHMTYRPRLAHIVRELGASNHRLQVDHGKGYLTRAEYRTLEGRSHAIRSDAMRVAENHRGAIPKVRFVGFQERIEKLNQSIHHAATT